MQARTRQLLRLQAVQSRDTGVASAALLALQITSMLRNHLHSKPSDLLEARAAGTNTPQKATHTVAARIRRVPAPA